MQIMLIISNHCIFIKYYNLNSKQYVVHVVVKNLIQKRNDNISQIDKKYHKKMNTVQRNQHKTENHTMYIYLKKVQNSSHALTAYECVYNKQ